MKIYLERDKDELGRAISLVKIKQGDVAYTVGMVHRELLAQYFKKVPKDSFTKEILQLFTTYFIRAYPEKVLEPRKEDVYFLNYQQVEDVVSNVFNLEEWSFAGDQESRNGACHRFVLDGKLSKEESAEIFALSKANRQTVFRAHDMLNYLCFLKILEPGTYIIEVIW